MVGARARWRPVSVVGMPEDPPAMVQSVSRALSILEDLAYTGEAGVTELAERLKVHKSTAFRLVGTLEAHGLVEQTEDRGKYRLSVGLLRLAGATTARLDVVHAGRAICRRLAEHTGETVNLAVLSESDALYLEQVAGSSTLQPRNWVGQHVPLHATSTGKVLLSELPSEDVNRLLRGLEPYTPHTITDPTGLRRELHQVRRRGYATVVDELEVGISAAAAPVRDAYGDVVASLSISGPTFRLTGETLTDAIGSLTESAEEISRGLGWVLDPN